MKKRGRSIAAVILVLLAAVGVAGFIWYRNSPFPTAIKLAAALKEGDADTVLKCIEPEAAEGIRAVMNLTGLSSKDLSGLLLGIQSGGKGLKDSLGADFSVKPAGYRREGDDAYISIDAAIDGKSDRWEFHFVRVSGEWYLALDLPSLF